MLKVRSIRKVEIHCSSAPDPSVLPFPTSGNIENTEKLQYSGEKLYKFTVTAYDCGKKRAADDAEVEIQVKPTCKPSWQGEGGIQPGPAAKSSVTLGFNFSFLNFNFSPVLSVDHGR